MNVPLSDVFGLKHLMPYMEKDMPLIP